MLKGGDQVLSAGAGRSAGQFWILAVFLVIVLATGGSSQPTVSSLMVLRPFAILCAAYGIFTLTARNRQPYLAILVMLGLLLALTAVHLLPLPPAVLHQLPGRDVIWSIDRFTGVSGEWRPLSMVPETTWNALYALSVPVAVVTLMIQLNAREHRRILQILIGLIVISGAVGLIQAIGVDFRLYQSATLGGGMLANRNHQATILALLFPMLAALSHGEGRSPMIPILCLALGVITIPLILVTGSRAGLVVSLVAMALIPWVLYRPGRARRHGMRGTILKIAGAAIVAVALVGLSIWSARDGAIDRLSGVAEDLRFPLWASIIEAMPRYMPWGSGIGSYADVYQIYEPDILLRPGFSNHAHNEYIEILFTAGLPGLAILVAAVLLFVVGVVKAARAGGGNGLFSRLGLAMIAVLAIASLFDYPIRTPLVSAVFAAAAIWASSFRRFGNDNGSV